MKNKITFSQTWQQTGKTFEEVKNHIQNNCGVFFIDGEIYTGMEACDETVITKKELQHHISLISIFDENYKPETNEKVIL